MGIAYKKLTETELETFIDMRISQLAEEYEAAGKEVPEDVDLKSALFDYYHKHMADGTFVSWLAVDGNRIVGTSGMIIRQFESNVPRKPFLFLIFFDPPV